MRTLGFGEAVQNARQHFGTVKSRVRTSYRNRSERSIAWRTQSTTDGSPKIPQTIKFGGFLLITSSLLTFHSSLSKGIFGK